MHDGHLSDMSKSLIIITILHRETIRNLMSLHMLNNAFNLKLDLIDLETTNMVSVTR